MRSSRLTSLRQGMRGRQREVPLIAEPPTPDIFIQKMKKIRDHRLQIAEMELTAFKQRCEASRQSFRQSVERLRQAQSGANDFWAQALQEFYSLAINSKLFVARKCHHQELKLHVSTCRFQAREAAALARADRAQLRLMRQALQVHRVQVEKLQLLKDISQTSSESALA